MKKIVYLEVRRLKADIGSASITVFLVENANEILVKRINEIVIRCDSFEVIEADNDILSFDFKYHECVISVPEGYILTQVVPETYKPFVTLRRGEV